MQHSASAKWCVAVLHGAAWCTTVPCGVLEHRTVMARSASGVKVSLELGFRVRVKVSVRGSVICGLDWKLLKG